MAGKHGRHRKVTIDVAEQVEQTQVDEDRSFEDEPFRVIEPMPIEVDESIVRSDKDYTKLPNPWLPALENCLNNVNAEEAAEAIVEAYNLKGVQNLLWRLCELTDQPQASNLISGREQFIVNRPEE